MAGERTGDGESRFCGCLGHGGGHSPYRHADEQVYTDPAEFRVAGREWE